MKIISLTRGRLALVDDEDFKRINQYKWHAVSINRTWYAARWTHGGHKTRRLVMMHRDILGDTVHGLLTDHRDGDGLNNQKQNLRPATHAQNMRNNRKKKPISGYRGVQKHGPGWQAKISINSKLHAIGTYRTAIEAARAYDRAAKEFSGEFARLNFP